MTRKVQCVKLNREAKGLDFQPYPGELGKKIFENVSKDAWQMWLEHQTMLINEHRLSLRDAKARAFIEKEMDSYFFGSGSKLPQGFVAPTKVAPPKKP
ncbi:MAG: oxidative damage protection protein [Acidiferrobacterales bacterium]